MPGFARSRARSVSLYQHQEINPTAACAAVSSRCTARSPPASALATKAVQAESLVLGTTLVAGACSEAARRARSASVHRTAGARSLRRAPRRHCVRSEPSDSEAILIRNSELRIHSDSHSDSDQTARLRDEWPCRCSAQAVRGPMRCCPVPPPLIDHHAKFERSHCLSRAGAARRSGILEPFRARAI